MPCSPDRRLADDGKRKETEWTFFFMAGGLLLEEESSKGERTCRMHPGAFGKFRKPGWRSFQFPLK